MIDALTIAAKSIALDCQSVPNRGRWKLSCTEQLQKLGAKAKKRIPEELKKGSDAELLEVDEPEAE